MGISNYPVSGSQTGTANTQLQFDFETHDATELNLIFQCSGGAGVFASQNATVEGSVDEPTETSPTWIALDTVGLGVAAFIGKVYNGSNKATTIVINPATCPRIRITVPALGSSIVPKVTWFGKWA